MIGITAFGAYVPRLRLQKKAMAQTNAWLAPNLEHFPLNMHHIHS